MTTMEQLFIKLPRDLQWEILETFVGTHVVRNGKLRRKLVLDSNDNQVLRLIQDRPWYNWLYTQHQHSDKDNKMIFTQWFYNRFYYDEDHWEAPITPIEPSDLPPFIKNVYPSYPYTNKKLGRSKSINS